SCFIILLKLLTVNCENQLSVLVTTQVKQPVDVTFDLVVLEQRVQALVTCQPGRIPILIVVCNVDALARSQQCDEAQSIIENYEKTNARNIVMWNTLLGSCRTYKKDKKAKEIYDKINEIKNISNDDLASVNVLLANIYASAGEFDKAQSIRQKMNDENIRKISGMTCIEINGVNHSFYAHDKSHPKSNEIYNELYKLQQELIDYGHKFDYNLITRRVKTEHGETPLSVIMGHSEKLAIAYGLIST
ncbi:unnamed protein product, partial [Didymodactylos carnosus]